MGHDLYEQSDGGISTGSLSVDLGLVVSRAWSWFACLSHRHKFANNLILLTALLATTTYALLALGLIAGEDLICVTLVLLPSTKTLGTRYCMTASQSGSSPSASPVTSTTFRTECSNRPPEASVQLAAAAW